MILAADQITQFKMLGYVIIPDFLDSKEISPLKKDFDWLVQEGKLRNVHTGSDGVTHSTTKFNLQIVPIGSRKKLKTPAMRALPFSEKVAKTVGALIGDPFVFYLDQLFFKPAGTGVGTNWHQDNAYFHIKDPAMGTGMWVALHDANVENGTLHVIPGSYRSKGKHRRDMASDHHITYDPSPEDEAKAVPVVVPAGGVIFFNYGTAHRTYDNKSTHDRAGLAYHFLNQAWVPENREHVFNIPVTGDKADFGLSAYGENQRDIWNTLIA